MFLESPEKPVYKNMIHSFYIAVILTCFQGKKCITYRSLMFRNLFICRIQGELSYPKSTRRVSGLSRNVRQTRDAQNVCAATKGGTVLKYVPANLSITLKQTCDVKITRKTCCSFLRVILRNKFLENNIIFFAMFPFSLFEFNNISLCSCTAYILKVRKMTSLKFLSLQCRFHCRTHLSNVTERYVNDVLILSLTMASKVPPTMYS